MQKLKMAAILVLALQLGSAASAQSSSLGQTPTWQEAIDAYSALHDAHPEQTSFETMGMSDVGRPLHLFTLGPRDAELKILINNAIHPGEPCGVNACIQWANELLQNPQALPEGVLIGMVPMYNVGGGLRRNCCTRANQQGPDEYGFRGNARNLDLNRDFIKCDSRNALTFNKMFTDFAPDIFVDTHTSNGADYPAEMTLICTQPDKLGGPLGQWLESTLLPELYGEMEKRGPAMTPYVYSLKSTPDSGIQDYLETPRYSTGYAALHHTIGFTSEAHMLKPFDQRVEATKRFLEVVLDCSVQHKSDIRTLRKQQAESYLHGDTQPVAWELDTTAVDSIAFTGYAARYEWSAITGERRLRYNRDSTWTQQIPYLHTFRPTRRVAVPAAFIVPQAWRHVLERLNANGVEFTTVPKDTSLMAEVAHILDHKASTRPYEGHHYRTVNKVKRTMEQVQLFAGDVVIPLDQPCARYLIETLSPEGVDSFMAWNFFDSALQQKEYFSAYVFEETAAELLEQNPEWGRALEEEKQRLLASGSSMGARQQLDFIYQKSDLAEGTSDRHPIFTIPAGTPIPFQ